MPSARHKARQPAHGQAQQARERQQGGSRLRWLPVWRTCALKRGQGVAKKMTMGVAMALMAVGVNAKREHPAGLKGCFIPPAFSATVPDVGHDSASPAHQDWHIQPQPARWPLSCTMLYTHTHTHTNGITKAPASKLSTAPWCRFRYSGYRPW